MDIRFCKVILKPNQLIRILVSRETVQIPAPKPYKLLFLMINTYSGADSGSPPPSDPGQDQGFLKRGFICIKVWGCALLIFIPPANFVCGGYTVFTLTVRACVNPILLELFPFVVLNGF